MSSAAAAEMDEHDTSSTTPSIYSLGPSDDVSNVVLAWKSEWSRINNARRRRLGKPEIMEEMKTDVAAAVVEPPHHGTRGAMKQQVTSAPTTPMDMSSTGRPRNRSHPSTPSDSPTRSPHRPSGGGGGLFDSSTYRTPSSRPSSTASSPHPSPSSSIHTSPSKPPSKHGSRMMAAAIAHNKLAAAAASSPVKRKLHEMLASTEETPTEGTSASSSSMNDINVTLETVSSSSSSVESSPFYKKPKLEELLTSSYRNPSSVSSASSRDAFPAAPLPVVMKKQSPKKLNLFNSAPRKKAAKFAGQNTPGIHNSLGIYSFTVGDDTPEDRQKKEWMVREYEEWKKNKDERAASVAAKGTQYHRGPIPPPEPQPQPEPELMVFNSPPLSALTSNNQVDALSLLTPTTGTTYSMAQLVTPTDSSITPMCATFSAPLLHQGDPKTPPSVRHTTHTALRPRHPSQQAHPPHPRPVNSHVRRSLYEELSRVATPNRSPTLFNRGGVFASAAAAAVGPISPIMAPLVAPSSPSMPLIYTTTTTTTSSFAIPMTPPQPPKPAAAAATPTTFPPLRPMSTSSSPHIPLTLPKHPPPKPKASRNLMSTFAQKKVTASPPIPAPTKKTLSPVMGSFQLNMRAPPGTPNIKSFFPGPSSSPIAPTTTTSSMNESIPSSSPGDDDESMSENDELIIV